MSTVICQNCGKPWMDTLNTRCPVCRTAPGDPVTNPQPVSTPANPPVAAAVGAAPAPTSAAHQPTLVAPVTAVPQTGPNAPMTQAQADKIIKLLEGRTTRRVDVVEPAMQASRVLETLAVIILILGALGALGALISVFTVSLWYGIMLGVGVVAFASAYWASLTVASVLAGYIANRS